MHDRPERCASIDRNDRDLVAGYGRNDERENEARPQAVTPYRTTFGANSVPARDDADGWRKWRQGYNAFGFLYLKKEDEEQLR